MIFPNILRIIWLLKYLLTYFNPQIILRIFLEHFKGNLVSLCLSDTTNLDTKFEIDSTKCIFESFNLILNFKNKNQLILMTHRWKFDSNIKYSCIDKINDAKKIPQIIEGKLMDVTMSHDKRRSLKIEISMNCWRSYQNYDKIWQVTTC